MTVTKAELIANIATRADLSKARTEELLNHVLSEISGQLTQGNDVTLPGVGKLVVTSRAAREGRNPKTGEAIRIPASKSVRFSPAKQLKQAL